MKLERYENVSKFVPEELPSSESPEVLQNSANSIFQRKNHWIFHPGGCSTFPETL